MNKLTRGRIVVILILLVIFALGGPLGLLLWFFELAALALYVSICSFLSMLVAWSCVHMWRCGL